MLISAVMLAPKIAPPLFDKLEVKLVPVTNKGPLLYTAPPSGLMPVNAVLESNVHCVIFISALGLAP